MTMPSLLGSERRSWESLAELSNDDLYSILGAEPTYQGPSSTPEYLLIGVRFEKTKAAIEAGQKRLRWIMESSRTEICERWRVVKGYKEVFERIEIVAIIAELLRRHLESDQSFPLLPVAELIARSCSYSLEALCSA